MCRTWPAHRQHAQPAAFSVHFDVDPNTGAAICGAALGPTHTDAFRQPPVAEKLGPGTTVQERPTGPFQEQPAQLLDPGFPPGPPGGGPTSFSPPPPPPPPPPGGFLPPVAPRKTRPNPSVIVNGPMSDYGSIFKVGSPRPLPGKKNKPVFAFGRICGAYRLQQAISTYNEWS